jgi:hypothetical protein
MNTTHSLTTLLVSISLASTVFASSGSWDIAPIEPAPREKQAVETRAEIASRRFENYEASLRAIEHAPAKTRAQVLAELSEARRLGLFAQGDRDVFASLEQLEQIRIAGLRAVETKVATNGVR